MRCPQRGRDDEFGELGSERLPARPAERLLCLPVPVDDASLAVDRHERVARRLDDHALLLFAGAQRILRKLGGRDVDQLALEQSLAVRIADRLRYAAGTIPVNRSMKPPFERGRIAIGTSKG